MRMLGRTATVLGLACLVQVPAVVAQTTGFESFRWYVGAQAGLIIFETPSQTRGGIFAAGAHVLITARRTGLLLSVEEGIKRNQLSSFADTTATGGVRQLVFNDLRKYSATLLAFPLRTIVQPYFRGGLAADGEELPPGDQFVLLAGAGRIGSVDGVRIAHRRGSDAGRPHHALRAIPDHDRSAEREAPDRTDPHADGRDSVWSGLGA